jgi:hypothetical protein
MITPALSSAAWGLGDASRRYDKAAGNVAGGPAVRGTDFASEFVAATIAAPRAHAADAAMLRTADELRGDLLDVLA